VGDDLGDPRRGVPTLGGVSARRESARINGFCATEGNGTGRGGGVVALA